MQDNLKSKYTQLIKAKAISLGFESVGIAKARFLEEEASNLEQWLKSGYQGEMSYLANNFDKRLDPTKLVEGAKSVISLSYNYFPDEEKTQRGDSYKIARYAYGQDYHYVVKDKVKELLEYIREEIGEVGGRAFTDSAPVMERAWAEQSGLGWRGKNSLLLQRNKGSYFFLAELIIDLDLEYDYPFSTDHCGTCTKCIDACPTNAIIDEKTVDGSKCISYFTIELKGAISNSVKDSFEDWMFGCDICQEVCPWNRFSKPHKESQFEPDSRLLNYDKSQWREITQEVFSEIFKKSAVKRTKFTGLIRNISFLQEE
jgi:epoxyqueuosine reductase